LTASLDAAGAGPIAVAVEAAARLRWGTVAPATWNRHAATVRSFLRYAARQGVLPELRVDLDRRREPADRTRALPKAALERLFNCRDVALRDKTLRRLLYETASRQRSALPERRRPRRPNRRAVIRGKNGEFDHLHWQTASGHALPPDRRPHRRTRVPHRPARLTQPGARRHRSLPAHRPRAAVLPARPGAVRRRQRRLDAAPLRHSALTHLAEESVSLALLMAKSRHTSLRSLQKYARPGVDAVAKLTADHDPAGRRRG
jgi:hypothetical protein